MAAFGRPRWDREIVLAAARAELAGHQRLASAGEAVDAGRRFVPLVEGMEPGVARLNGLPPVRPVAAPRVVTMLDRVEELRANAERDRRWWSRGAWSRRSRGEVVRESEEAGLRFA